MADGSWEAEAKTSGSCASAAGNVVNGGGGSADASGFTETADSSSGICGTGQDGQWYNDKNKDGF